MVDTKPVLKKIGVPLAGVTALALGLMWWANWIPFPDFLIHPYVVASAVIVLIAAVSVWKYRGKAPRPRWQDYLEQDKQVQLSDKQAFELLRYELGENRFLSVGDLDERGAEIVGPEDQEDNVRLYKMVYDRKLVNEKVGVVLDLEQDLDVDPYDTESLRKAAEEIQNIKVKRSSKVDDLDEALEDAVSSLGRSLDQKITDSWVKEGEDGREVIRERSIPASLYKAKQRLPGNNSSEEVGK